jgi:hypothetical protein
MKNADSFLVVDTAKNRDYDYLWADFFKVLEQTDDPLKANYTGLDPTQFASLPVVIKDDKIVCFSGLQVIPSKWGNGIARCSARMWYHPDYRLKGLSKFTGGDKFLNSTFCMPIQLAVARQLGLDCLFISRESNIKGFEQYLNLLKVNAHVDFTLEPDWYNVCGKLDPVPHSCKQVVALHYLTSQGASVWQNNMLQFKL